MPHIHTEANQHDLTVTAYIIRTDTTEPQALIHMHKKLGRLLPVGGHVELHETPWQSIAHEVEEEAGYTLNQLHILQPKSRIKSMSKAAQHPTPLSMNTHAIPGDHFHTDIQYAFVTTLDPTLELSEDESADIRWVTQLELNALESEVVFTNTKEIYNFIFDEALPTWDVIQTSEFILDFPEEYK